MRCSTVPSTTGAGDDPCAGEATHMLLGSVRGGEPFKNSVCQPCGESFVRKPGLQARLVALRLHMPDSVFIEIVEGHRLTENPEHETRCFDCGTAGSPTWFRFQPNGCPGRPESITVLHYSREFLQSGLDKAKKSARMWWDYAVGYLHMPVEDWQVVTDHAHYSAFFTFRGREYGVRHDLPAGRVGAEKLPNRGRPKPNIVNPDDSYNQAVFRFHNRFADSGSPYFATWTPGHANITDRELIILHAPEGQIAEVLYVPGLRGWDETTGAICDAFGPISHITLQTRIYG
ncbi:hypothetical protein [Streptomyces acidiscabies]|uniref:C2H2-type domain-containing protein n=1 Tax=Streptomyces acidiscabies TaxID=42234 RepID=A0ABU4LXL4_9ACTN|nr:hypothetical protein [Streptomyces acidiscabies]MDX3020004.1 hypothetical protein [Streptomyces acidiscabies]